MRLGVVLLAALLAQAATRVEKTAYQGWRNCYRISNGTVEVIVTTDVGPRVIRYGFAGGENEFFEDPKQAGRTGGNEWRAYGGHRLWHAPEAMPRTYWPDNGPVETEDIPGGLRLIQAVEGTTGIQKEIDVRLAGEGSRVHLVHRLRNQGPWPVELAPWTLTVMAPGGVGIFPLPPRGPHPQNLLPTSRIAMWAYTDFSDPRWQLGYRYLLLRQDANAKTPQKIGLSVPDGWAAYLRGEHLFVKRFTFEKDASYPDYGVNVESFTNADMLELETLGPLAKLQPGAVAEHAEHWFLYRGVRWEKAGDEGVIQAVLPRVKESQIR
jgi:hypothetical protein